MNAILFHCHLNTNNESLETWKTLFNSSSISTKKKCLRYQQQQMNISKEQNREFSDFAINKYYQPLYTTQSNFRPENKLNFGRPNDKFQLMTIDRFKIVFPKDRLDLSIQKEKRLKQNEIVLKLKNTVNFGTLEI